MLIGNKIGFVVGVLLLDEYFSYKKLVKLFGNKKVGMILLKDLEWIIGY